VIRNVYAEGYIFTPPVAELDGLAFRSPPDARPMAV